MTSIRSLVLAALVLAAGAARAEEQVYLFQTQESDAVETGCLPGQNIVLGAYVYAPRTRASDGKLVRELGQPVGTVVGCGTLTSIAVGATAPFSMDFDLEGRKIFASGECKVTQAFVPNPATRRPVLLVGCSLGVEASAAEPTLRGIATSASVFIPYPIPGYATGSFWTLHLY